MLFLIKLKMLKKNTVPLKVFRIIIITMKILIGVSVTKVKLNTANEKSRIRTYEVFIQ